MLLAPALEQRSGQELGPAGQDKTRNLPLHPSLILVPVLVPVLVECVRHGVLGLRLGLGLLLEIQPGSGQCEWAEGPSPA